MYSIYMKNPCITLCSVLYDISSFLFFRTFLCDLGGNPNKKNGDDETSVHCVCRVGQAKSPSAEDRRAACIVLILQWRGPILQDGEKERAQLNAQDKVCC